jgi:hypothetical protein
MKYCNLQITKIADKIDKQIPCEELNHKVDIYHIDGSFFSINNAKVLRLDDYYIIVSKNHRPLVYHIDDYESRENIKEYSATNMITFTDLLLFCKHRKIKI